jgi:DNA-binding CsgD family transcriptional regulator
MENPRTLKDQEFSILFFASHGFTAAETGRMILLATETVKSYRKLINHKLDARSLTHSVAIALREGFI